MAVYRQAIAEMKTPLPHLFCVPTQMATAQKSSQLTLAQRLPQHNSTSRSEASFDEYKYTQAHIPDQDHFVM